MPSSTAAAPSASPSAGPSFFSGFTHLCKGLALVLVGGYALLQIFPSAVTYLALIPARTIPFAWNLITSGYIEQSLPGVMISTFGLLFIGKLLEPIWGSREFMKFILIVNFLTSICVFVTAIALYYVTRQESYLEFMKGIKPSINHCPLVLFNVNIINFLKDRDLKEYPLMDMKALSYTPVSGFLGVLSGFLVGIKQIMPDQEVGLFFLLKIKAKWLPSVLVLMSVVLSLFTTEALSYIPTLVFGIYTSWIYLRYLQRKPETNLRGDPNDDFAFSTFFPGFLRPVLDPIASVFHALLCGRSEISVEAKGYTLGGSPLPGSDPIEASRRRERGARALEQRLAAEKSSTAGTAVGASSDGDVNNV